MSSNNHFMHSMLEALEKYSSRSLMKLLSNAPSDPPSWSTITYADFRRDLEKSAAHWTKTLTEKKIQQKSVVGVWITGTSYHDFVHMYGLVRAGYIPQMFGLKMSFNVIVDLLAFTQGKAMIYDPSLSDKMPTEFGLPNFPYPNSATITETTGPIPDLPVVDSTDMAMIFHTSGTTSGRPKCVPQPHRWIKSMYPQWHVIWQADFKGETPTFTNIGSFANFASACAAYYLACSGHCLIQTSKPDFDTAELFSMVKEGLNGLMIYAPWLSGLLDIARKDAQVLETLRGLAQIAYTGTAMKPEDDRWAIEQNIPISVFYAGTETAPCLVSDFADKSTLPLMRLVAPQAKFIPASVMDKNELDGDTINRFQGGQLYDLFLPDTAPQCPHPWIRNRPDGHITGDLFEEVKPGLYAFRGRNDDWIRTGKYQSFCDTKAIEDNVMRVCSDIITNCVIVGHYKPAVVLFVEPLGSFNYETGSDDLKRQILERTLPFNQRLLPHEQIMDPLVIVIVRPSSLPRTVEKGNIRRRAAEEEYKEVLENIYSKVVPK
ncbi:acetyl-CoA synthetase-like protein [Mycena floridula]|nr:acetyl-CoA synthetase-like protein [Mycena floridula]